MPTYSYHCEECGHNFDYFQKITDEHLKICPKCEKSSLRRLIGSGAGFIFKGSGFYITDYRTKEYKEKATAEKSSTGSSSSTKVAS